MVSIKIMSESKIHALSQDTKLLDLSPPLHSSMIYSTLKLFKLSAILLLHW